MASILLTFYLLFPYCREAPNDATNHLVLSLTQKPFTIKDDTTKDPSLDKGTHASNHAYYIENAIF